MDNAVKITVEVLVHAPIETAWKVYTQPEFVTQWNHASNDWHSPRAENDLRIGGTFNYRMEAKDGSVGFDFSGTYTAVKPLEHIAYTMGDRKVEVNFAKNETNTETNVTVVFEAETENSIELQRGGWQAILDNYQKCAEQS